MNEHELERLAQNLGARAADRLDVEATARVVTERLRQQPAPQRVGRALPEWLRIAATVVLLLGAGFALQRVGPAPQAGVPYTFADLTDLTTAELSQLLAGLDGTLEGAETDSTVIDLDQLTPAQLQTLLRSLET